MINEHIKKIQPSVQQQYRDGIIVQPSVQQECRGNGCVQPSYQQALKKGLFQQMSAQQQWQQKKIDVMRKIKTELPRCDINSFDINKEIKRQRYTQMQPSTQSRVVQNNTHQRKIDVIKNILKKI